MLTLQNITFRYKKDAPLAMAGVSFSVKSGEKVLVVGENGAGKTTLSKIVCGLLPGADGERGILHGNVLLDGKALSAMSRRDIVTRIAILFQDFESQIVSSSAMEEMLFYAENTGIGFAEASRRVRDIAQRFGVAHLLSRDISELSGGEKQKIALFSLLTVNPGMLILDEPFTDIEPSSQEYILDFIRGDSFGGALVLLEQTLDFYKYFRRIIILHEGRMLYDGGPGVVSDASLLAAAGLDMPEMCRIFPGLATGADAAERAHRDRKFDAAAYASLISDAGAREAPALIEARGLRFRYPGARTLALDNVDLVVRQGDFVAVLGANGSGKTTLTKLIAGVLRPSGGELLYKGASVSPGDIGYVYQNPDSQIFAETVFDEVAFALRMKKMAPDEIRVRVEAVLHSMGLSDKLRFDPFALPKGDRQKIACASILVAQPEVIVLDEPTTGLDFPSLTEMMALIAELNRQGKTILMITHSVRAAAAFSRTVLAMNEGKAIYYGPLREFFAQEERVREAHAERTDVMDLSMALNGNMILTAQEFQQCWPETEGKGS